LGESKVQRIKHYLMHVYVYKPNLKGSKNHQKHLTTTHCIRAFKYMPMNAVLASWNSQP
jgi:hypothetical protein